LRLYNCYSYGEWTLKEKILVTGGAGFIGSHLVDALVVEGYSVRVLDNLEPQVHGGLREQGKWPVYSNPGAEYILGDIRDFDLVSKVIQDMEVIFHEASLVGVGQSMYEIARYTDANANGTAVLLQAIIGCKPQIIRKMVVASSMSIYGEGAYICRVHGKVYPKLREQQQLAKRDWELYCPMPKCREKLATCPTDEDKPLFPTSVYATNKRDQEELFLSIGKAYSIPSVALRYFNVYGTRQALSNPYTGVAAIFSARLLNGNPPVIFEDGFQSRDFTHVSDIVQANLAVMENNQADGGAFNIGTGRCLTILEMAEALGKHMGFNQPPVITGQFRAGDIRHCYADIQRLTSLGYHPRVRFEAGIAELVEWVHKQTSLDYYDLARNELVSRGLAS
jgi:dTDP-L-rhamnose 4-epimerase